VLNGIEAMQSITDRARELVIRSEQHDAHHVRVTVIDCGVGFSAKHAERLFTSFFTTNPVGWAWGFRFAVQLSTRTGPHLATSNLPHGATIQFTLPSHPGLHHERFTNLASFTMRIGDQHPLSTSCAPSGARN